MSKRGFTLVELLATIVLIGILGGIAVISYSAIVEKSKLQIFKSYEESMHAETMSYLTRHIELIPRKGETVTFIPSEIGMATIVNPRNKADTCPDSYIEVTRNDYEDEETNTYVDALDYKVCLICKDSDYNVNGTDCLIIQH